MHDNYVESVLNMDGPSCLNMAFSDATPSNNPRYRFRWFGLLVRYSAYRNAPKPLSLNKIGVRATILSTTVYTLQNTLPGVTHHKKTISTKNLIQITTDI